MRGKAMSMDSHRKTILVVDDAPENIDLLVGLLKDRYTVKAALNGTLALKICRSAPPDLVLMDLMMPEMDGYEACRQLNDDPVTAGIPVIFLSSEDVKMAGEHGAVAYLSKPIDPEKLTATIETVLQG